MTKENTVVYIEIKEMEGNKFPLSEGNRRVSIFINDYLWVAIGNLGEESHKVRVQPLQEEDKGDIIMLNPKSLTVLRYYDLKSRPEVLQF